MSSNYCVQLNQNFGIIGMFTVYPVNFTSLQFSLSVNSLVIFLFSKCPFSHGNAGSFCINHDAFGFAKVGTDFNINLSNYKGYYMLIMIYPQGIDLYKTNVCEIEQNLTMSFKNTTISLIQNMNIESNYGYSVTVGTCSGCQVQTINVTNYCNNSTFYVAVFLNNLNNYLVTTACQMFVYVDNITVKFATSGICANPGIISYTQIVFFADQQVIDFLNSNNIPYNIVSPLSCKHYSCVSVYQIKKLLTPPKKHSIISSKLWNEIVQDLYLAYSIYKYIKYLSQFPYPQNITYAILDFYDFYKNFQPYMFKPLIHAKKGLPLTADYFNSLIDAIIELANFVNIQLQKNLSHVQSDEIVKALQFVDIVYNVNQLLTFNYNQYFLFSCYGYEFYNLLNSISTFLNVLITNLQISPTISQNIYIKNFLIYSNSSDIFIYGTIANLIINYNNGFIFPYNNSYINFLNINTNNELIELYDNSSIHTLNINVNYNTILLNDNTLIGTINIKIDNGGIDLNDNSSITIINVQQENGGIYLNDYSKIYTINVQINNKTMFLENYSSVNSINIEIDNNGINIEDNVSINTIDIGTENNYVYLNNNTYVNILNIETNNGKIQLYNNAYIKTLYIENNVGDIYLYDNAVIENLICKQNTGAIYIYGNAKIINNQCIS